MGNTPAPFRQHHLARALRAASSAGVRDPAVCIELPNGTRFTVGAAAGLPNAAVVSKAAKARSVPATRKLR
jgi:hypothetical protein